MSVGGEGAQKCAPARLLLTSPYHSVANSIRKRLLAKHYVIAIKSIGTEVYSNSAIF